jgi:hypothetical protein
VRPYLLGRGHPALEVARPDQHSEALRDEILCDLKTDSLIGPDDQGDAPILHVDLRWVFFNLGAYVDGPLLARIFFAVF